MHLNNEVQILNILAEVVINDIVKGIKCFFKERTTSNEYEDIDETNSITILKSHFTQIDNWARQIHFHGYNRLQETNDITLELNISFNVRKFMGFKYIKDKYVITEEELLNSHENYLILGDPGAGKTTTLRRIIRKNIFQPKNNKYPFIILIRLKELTPINTISKKICEIMGINYTSKEIEVKSTYIDEGNIEVVKTYYETRYFVENLPISTAVAELLNYIDVTILLDGIDEINNNIKSLTLIEIQDFSEKLSAGSKIIATCRSGDYYKPLNGFNVCEIADLNDSQIEKISNMWLGDSKQFMHEIEQKPYKDLCNRPLFLTQLLLLFTKDRELPEKSIDIYEKIVDQVVREWDYNRDIVRHSKYSGFDIKKKVKFLSELSFNLTYEIKTKIFNDKIFEQAYNNMYKKFALPKNEVRYVGQEIESHNGLIVKSHGNFYEFSHLSIQEYLCACYLVTLQTNSKKLANYFHEYAAPLAIAVALSGNSSNWFASLVFKVHVAEIPMSVFLSRIIFEKPYFNEDEDNEMGFAILLLLLRYYNTNILDLIHTIILMENVESMLVKALSKFKPIDHVSEDRKYSFVNIHFDKNYSNKFSFQPPQDGNIDRKFLLKLYNKYTNELHKFKWV